MKNAAADPEGCFLGEQLEIPRTVIYQVESVDVNHPVRTHIEGGEKSHFPDSGNMLNGSYEKMF